MMILQHTFHPSPIMRFDAYVLAASIFNATIGRITPRNNDSTSRSAFRTCRRIQSALGPDVVQLSGAEYSATASSAWSLFNAASQPTCIVFPQSAKDVQVAMGAIFQDKIHYAVQSGGHSAMTGWNTVQDGVLFFFSRMKNASYDAVKDTITLQPGIRWGEALTELESLGVAPMGGRFGDVGTGLLLGGGLSYLSGEHGFSSDAYVELDVVLVTGKLVTATATNEYSDLFWALKGGANRFGIVTRYEVQAIHTGTNAEKNWFGGFIMYPNSSADALLQATEKFVRIVSDPRASLLMVFGYTANGTEVTPIHLLSLFYHGSALPEPIFGDFLSIPATLTQLSPVSYVEANSLLGPGADRGFGHLFGASAFNNSVGVETYFTSFREFSDYTLKSKIPSPQMCSRSRQS
ncbi:unnamed protein product [Cyclocybe aegerita]|uniref:FAD-binding PCMH-type domain-containing protein n=1 Tax=Cyclocybe aegerita TaxID=1973307 RepID=A0A8S0VQ35_CYCAE|nr:unnamed protein product [Cyclocybe aegerita]